MGCCGRLLSPVIDKVKQLEKRLNNLVNEKKLSMGKCSFCGKSFNKVNDSVYCSYSCKRQHNLVKDLKND